ncbi:MAG: LexA family protein [Crocosphaera sp.]
MPHNKVDDLLELPCVLNPNNYYALRVEGNGLVESVIAPEDTVIIRRLTPEETVKNGEIVAVKVEGHGVSLRRYNLEKEQVTLTSFDKETTLKVPRTTVEIQGVVVGIWRDN